MRVGVTGNYASGKGTVCEIFQDLGGQVIDTDLVAREIVQPNTIGLQKIVTVFGEDYLDQNGFLKRRDLAQFVFQDPLRVKKLNEITHPLILDIVLEKTSKAGFFFINTPLLFEAKFHLHMDKNIVVMAKESQLLDRGQKRDNLSLQEIKDRLKNQFSLNEKIKLADYIIDNSKTFEKTKRQVKDLWNNLTKTT